MIFYDDLVEVFQEHSALDLRHILDVTDMMCQAEKTLPARYGISTNDRVIGCKVVSDILRSTTFSDDYIRGFFVERFFVLPVELGGECLEVGAK